MRVLGEWWRVWGVDAAGRPVPPDSPDATHRVFVSRYRVRRWLALAGEPRDLDAMTLARQFAAARTR